MALRRLVARGISQVIALRPPQRQEGLRILLYHSIGSHSGNASYGINVTPREFQRQMTRLKQLEGVRLVSVDQALAGGAGFQVAITFDDGYKDNLYVAAPTLTTLQIPFTVFVVAGFIGNRSEYLSPVELRELAQLPGVTIGAHGFSHCRLAECDDSVLWGELNDSRRILEDMIDKPVTAISYPHGSVSQRVRDAAETAGYTVGATSCFGLNRAGGDPLQLHRCEILSRDNQPVFFQKLAGHWDWRGKLPL